LSPEEEAEALRVEDALDSLEGERDFLIAERDECAR
jgi:hypothetical protein